MRNSPILLVDDDKAYRDSMGYCLSSQGYVVHQASDGASALEMLKCQSFSLLISDFEMPNMNGVELFKQVRRLQPEIEGILVSGEMTESRTNAALTAGMLAALHKLSDRSALFALISTSCGRDS